MRGNRNAIVVAFSYKIFREGLSEKVTFEQKSLGGKFVGRIFQAKRTSSASLPGRRVRGLLEMSEEESVSVAGRPHES